MDLLKDTPLEVAWRVWRARPQRPSLTVVVKATFDLVNDGQCPLAEEQALPTGDRHYDEDPERSLMYPSDLEPLKPRAECFVVGAWYAPGGVPTQRSRVAFQIGAVQKQADVFGPRYVSRGRTSEPLPMASVELVWESSYGGPGVAENPVGKGIRKEVVDGREVVPLPQVEGAGRAPVGFAPIARTWKSRLALAGTYDSRWLAERYPWFPEDIDWEHFNAAPHDQRIDGFFAGDEEIRLVNLHPDRAWIACRLPGTLPRALLVPTRGAPRQLPLRCDTLIVDSSARQVFAVWRAVAEIDHEDLSDVAHLFVTHDTLGTARDERALADAYARALTDEQAAARASEPEPIPEPEPSSENPGAKWAHLDQAMTERGDVAAFAALFARGIGARPDSMKSVFSDALGLGTPEPEPEPELSPEEVLELEMQLALGDLLTTRDSPERERVRQAVASGESLAGVDLTGVDLSGLTLRGADFRKAILARANFSASKLMDACFDGASLVEAELSHATFERCSFVASNLTGARAERVRFDDFQVVGAFISSCFMRDARFAQSVFTRAELVESDLSRAGFRDCNLDEADFTRATLEEALFQACTLRDAWLEGVKAARARLDGCDATLLRGSEQADFSGASFKKAALERARFSGARLDGANFAIAKLARADFSGAAMTQASMIGCDLRQARFDAAIMVRAALLKSNLFRARLERADLRFADLRGCNLYQAELFEAQLEGARLELVDLRGTRRE